MNQQYYNEQRKQRDSEKLGITRNQYSYIMRIGSHLRYLYELNCNGFETEKAQERHDRQEIRYERIARKFARDNNLHIYLQTDCRGATVYLDKKPIPENNYNQAVCIY